VPTIDLTDNELAEVIDAVGRAIREDKFPRAPRLDPLKAILAKLTNEPAKPAPRKPLPMLTARPVKGKRGLRNR
jgi:hypothetical protein